MSTAVAERPPQSPPPSTALTPAQQKFVTVRDLLQKRQQEILSALPRHIKSDYFIRVALTSVQRTPKLLEADPISLLGALYQCAQLGLVPDPILRQAYLVPFMNNKRTPPRLEVQFIPGYVGLIELVRRSGELSTIDADVVRAKDTFRFMRGFNPTFEHSPYEGDDPGDVVKAYAWLRLKDGSHLLKVMTRREIDAIRKRSKAANNGPWVTDYDWMAKKTVLKQLCKLAPMSIEAQSAVALDDRAEAGLPQDLTLLVDPNDAPTPIEEDETGGETLDMPQRASEQAPNGSASASTNGPASTNGGPLIDRIVDSGRVGNGWAARTQGGLLLWTRDQALGEQLAAATNALRQIWADPADAQGRRKLTRIEA